MKSENESITQQQMNISECFATINAPVPLSNAGPTGVGQDHTPNIAEDF